MQFHAYDNSYTASSSGDASGVTSESETSSSYEPAPPTTKYGRFDLENEPVAEGLDFLTYALPITIPEAIAEHFRAGAMTPVLVYDQQRKMLQIGVKPWQDVSVELNGVMLAPNLLVDLIHGSVVRIGFRVGNANFIHAYFYRERHVFSVPGKGGVYCVEVGELGAGTCGTVRRCRVIGDFGIRDHEPFEVQGDVAVKVVGLPEKAMMTEVKREVLFLKKLKDIPGFIRLIDNWGDETLRELYIVMELVTQGCLRGLIRHIRHARIYLPEDDVRVFAYNVLRSIASMHAREIIHGDLKPGNILCTSAPGSLCGIISDLGGAKHTSELQQAHVYVGGYNESAKCRIGKPSAWTRGYSAPEMGKPDADARAHDIHCFGATLFELMTKRKLFSEEHHCKLGDSCTNAVCPGRRRVYHFTQLREGNFSSQAYVFVKQLVFPDSPSMRLSAAQALANPWFTLPGEAMMPIAWDFVDETVFDFERDAYVARVEGGRGRVAGPAPSRTEMPSKESGQSTPQKDQKKMDTDQQLYGQDDGEWASEETSASFRVSLDDLEVGQEMHVWRVEHYRHDAAGLAPTTDEWQVQLPQADAAVQP